MAGGDGEKGVKTNQRRSSAGLNPAQKPEAEGWAG